MARTEIETELDHFWIGTGPYADLAANHIDNKRKAIAKFLDRHIVIPRSEPVDGEITEEATPNGITVKAGSGPERVYEFIHVNPNWLRNKAVNLLNVADYIENRDAIVAAKEAEATAARDKRRDEIATELVGNPCSYHTRTPAFSRAIDRIIELEDAAK
ncbi:MAG TPA: hypothetical protein VF885_16075 [Arthrobacter sp.]